ncbi:lipid droplet-associated protein [Actinokineospora bangkokensis]|uniref:Lipid droplet-associated protein n=1 Tax=Actinokineospora bangkokensis TaxID=1193682 RepID=A0A1Q9LDI1_9PSEU|nr:lipid droplet-associated protein [Actinokineospora bangkokensis]OLR90064.1 hypothetical protein BJP25_03550 [Actinokineospora bangkokensis]
MKPLPLPVRLAAGLAATAVERARDLPTVLAGLPVTIASQALQASMRVQQQVTELAIKGDAVLSALRPVEESPEWATFDEDADDYDLSRPAFDRVGDDDLDDDLEYEDEDDSADEDSADEDSATEGSTVEDTADPAEVEPALDADPVRDPEAAAELEPGSAEEDAAAEEAALVAEAEGADPWEQEQKAIAGAPAAVPNYDELSLPQLRARLRVFSIAELEELLAYERAGENRASFTGMLVRRIETVRAQQ